MMKLFRPDHAIVSLLHALSLTLLLMLGACQSPAVLPGGERQSMDRLLMLIDQRLNVATMVAQSKWNSGAAIDDPVREQKILDDMSVSLADADRLFIRRFFQAQFDAGKIIQRDLHAQWRREGRSSFDHPPDLARTVRPELDHLTPLLIDALHQVRPLLRQAASRDYLRQRSRELVRDDVAGGGSVREQALHTLLQDS